MLVMYRTLCVFLMAYDCEGFSHIFQSCQWVNLGDDGVIVAAHGIPADRGGEGLPYPH